MSVPTFALCADDYALTPGVSAGILELMEADRLTAVSALTTGPYWVQGARALRATRGRVEVGLHLNLTYGSPLDSMPYLAPQKTFPSLSRLIYLSLFGLLPLAEIQRQISCQIDVFEAEMDQSPHFIDGHQHIHVLPGVRWALFAEIERRNLMGQIWVRASGDLLSRILQRRCQVRKASAIAFLARGFAQEAQGRGILTNDGFSGFSAFQKDVPYEQEFAASLLAMGPRHLLMCHPGYVDMELERIDPVTHTRLTELSFFLSPRFPDMLARRGVEMLKVLD